MLKSYEAIYEHGQLRWLGQEPAVTSARVLVVIEEAQTDAREQDIDQLLQATSGAWGNKPVQEVREMIEQQRQSDWEEPS
jgi:hypothetical protein